MFFFSLFADDLKIATIINTPNDIQKLQNAINKLKNWCTENDLHLNLDKCSVIITNKHASNIITGSYYYGDHKFGRVNEHRDLGVLVDSKLNFIDHINAITAKATSMLGFVKRFCHDIKNTHTLKSLYYSLVQSIFEYCSVVWLPFYECHKAKIESVLKQFTMFALREYPNASNNYIISSYDQRLLKLEMQSLDIRRINSAAVSYTHLTLPTKRIV